MDDSSFEKTEEWTESKLGATALEDQDWIAIKEESLFSNESFFVRKYNDLAEEDKQEKAPLKVEEKDAEGVWSLFDIYVNSSISLNTRNYRGESRK
jgi:hypothetical protein